MLEEKQVIHFCYGQSTLHLTELENSSALALTTIKRLWIFIITVMKLKVLLYENALMQNLMVGFLKMIFQ